MLELGVSSQWWDTALSKKFIMDHNRAHILHWSPWMPYMINIYMIHLKNDDPEYYQQMHIETLWGYVSPAILKVLWYTFDYLDVPGSEDQWLGSMGYLPYLKRGIPWGKITHWLMILTSCPGHPPVTPAALPFSCSSPTGPVESLSRRVAGAMICRRIAW